MNCARALKGMHELQSTRGDGNTLTLWVDAICFDRGNTSETSPERAPEFQIMGRIYKMASHVIACSRA
jgi:hypothetical protein